MTSEQKVKRPAENPVLFIVQSLLAEGTGEVGKPVAPDKLVHVESPPQHLHPFSLRNVCPVESTSQSMQYTFGKNQCKDVNEVVESIAAVEGIEDFEIDPIDLSDHPEDIPDRSLRAKVEDQSIVQRNRADIAERGQEPGAVLQRIPFNPHDG